MQPYWSHCWDYGEQKWRGEIPHAIVVYNRRCMPELPEVETIRRQAEELLVGQTIKEIEIKRASIIRGDIKSLKGKKIIKARRFAKLLVLDFSGGVSLAIHLKMTGRLAVFAKESEFFSHTHVVFTLSNGKFLTFSDIRRFGYLQVVETTKVGELKFIKSLAKEPLSGLTLLDFSHMLSRSSRPIKLLLLDQTKIGGVGNIYDCESLWMAKIHPKQPANSLSTVEIKRLFSAIEEVLAEGISRGGASDNTYRDLHGEKGHYQDYFKVYQQQGKPCKRDGTLIKRVAMGGRGTFFCPTCQVESSSGGQTKLI